MPQRTRAVQETGRRSGADGSIAGTPYIGTEHLLLSLLAEGDGIAAQVLAGRGAGAQVVEPCG